MATITWKSGVNGGDWTTATNWVGGVLPAPGDTAVIDGGTGFTDIGPVIPAGTSIDIAAIVLTGTDGTLDLMGTLAATSVDISGDGLLDVHGSASIGSLTIAHGLYLEGTLDITTTATLDGGTILMQDGTLSGTVEIVGGSISGPGTLQSVTLGGTVAAFGTFMVLGGLTLTAATAKLAGDALDFAGTQTLTANTITDLPTISASGTLTIAAGTTLDDAGSTLAITNDPAGAATFINDGLITALAVELDTDIVNHGTIVLTGTLPGDNVQFDPIDQFDNAGTLALAGGDTLSPLFHTSSAFSNSGLIEVGASSTLDAQMAGNVTTVPTIVNRGGTVALAAGSVLLGDVPVLGGTIASSGGTIEDALDSLTVVGSVALLGRSGGDDIMFAPDGSAPDVITLAPHDAGEDGALTDAATLTFAAGTTLELDETTAGDTTLDTSFPISAASLALEGVVAALPGGAVTLDATGTLSNSGTIETGAGETLVLRAAVLQDTGGVDLVAGSTLGLDAPITLAALTALAGDAEIVLSSTLDLGGGTVTLAPGSLFSRVMFGNGAVVADGTFVEAGLTPVLSGATLSDVTWVGGIDLSPSRTVAAENGLTVRAAGGGAGLLTIGGTVNELNLLTATTLDGMTVALGGTLETPVTTDVDVLSAQTDLSIGPAALVSIAGNNPNSELLAYGSLSNAGAIAFSGGGTGDIDGMFAAGPVDNTGTIEISGETADVASPLSASSFAVAAAENGTGADVGLAAAAGLLPGLSWPELETIDIKYGYNFDDFLDDLEAQARVMAGLSDSSPEAVQASRVETASAIADGIDATVPALLGTITGAGTMLLGAGGALLLNDVVDVSQTVAFGAAGAVLGLTAPQDFAAHIVDFGFADGIDLFVSGYVGGVPGYSDGVLSVPVAGGALTLNVGLAAGVTASELKLSEDSLGGTFVSVACFAQGTRIATPCGPVPVERLHQGDRVRTASGATREIAWLGHRRLTPHRHPRPQDVQPVRIRQNAFAPGVPHRDLHLSPDHAVLADGALIPIRYLINGATIVQEDVSTITYWHVELPTHDVLLAEGMPCESYLDTGNRPAFVEHLTPPPTPGTTRPHARPRNPAPETRTPGP